MISFCIEENVILLFPNNGSLQEQCKPDEIMNVEYDQAKFKVKYHAAIHGLLYNETFKSPTKILRSEKNIEGFKDKIKKYLI
jgi:hypothetical protein